MLVWEGPVDVEGIDAALSEQPTTHEVLMELASQVDLDAIPDALRCNRARDRRWRSALRAVLAAAGRCGAVPRSSAKRLASLEHATQMVPLRDGYLCLCHERGAADAKLVRLDSDGSVKATRPLLGVGGKLAVLPRALRDSDEAVVVLHARGAIRFCHVLDDALRVVARADARLPDARSEVRYFDRIGEELVIEGEKGMFWSLLRPAPDELVFPDEDGACDPPRRFLSESFFGFFRRTLPVWVDGWLVMTGDPELVKGRGWVSRKLHWIHLDRDVVHTTDTWPRSATGWTVHRGALWIASDEGLHRCLPGSDVEIVSEKSRRYYGMASGSEGLILSTRNDEWVTTDHEGRPLDTGGLPAETSPFATRALADGLLVGSQTWMWIGSEGVRASSAEGGALITPEDRHVVSGFVSGASGFAVDGTSLLRVDFPGDATVEASFGDRILARVGSARYVFGRDGLCLLQQEDLSPPKRTHYGGGSKGDGGLVEDDRILMVRAGREEIWAWRPAELDYAWSAPPAPRRIGDQKCEGYEKRNPRDDWAEPGLQVDGEVVHASRCRYGGDYGAAGEAPAIIARRGAIVTLEDCVLVRGGALVEGYSTVFAVRCELAKGRYVARPGSHLVLIDCTLAEGVNLVGAVRRADSLEG